MHFETSTALTEVTHLVVEHPREGARRCEIETLRGSAKGPILRLVGISNCDEANRLRGAKLWVEKAALPPLSEGEYYLVDLVGCEVRLLGSKFAEVTSVRPDPSVDTMVIRLTDGRTAEVPIVDAWIGQVDVGQRVVELLSEDGIIY
jgi:16S rRNA processing protein RimM